MPDKKTELSGGMKTFFVNPDVSLFPETLREELFMNGYETYFLFDDFSCPIEKKIHILYSLFPYLILFFNIDRKIPGIDDWAVFIAKLQTMYKDRGIIGVLYTKGQTAEQGRGYEKLYLYDIGIQGGCISLGYQKNKNQMILNSVLTANQANGQRKNIRMLCDSAYKMYTVSDKTEIRGTLTDLSVSHFSCVFDEPLPEIPVNEFIPELLFNFRGVYCKSAGMLVLKRVINGKSIFVFVFKTHDRRDGLEPDTKLKISNLIYTKTTMEVEELLRQIFAQVKKQALSANR